MDRDIHSAVLENTCNDSFTLKVALSDSKVLHLHSTCNPEQEASDWLGHFDITPNTAYFVLGFGLGYHVRELLAILPENCRIYVFEYSKAVDLPQLSRKLFAGEAWLEDERVSYLYNDNLRNSAAIILGHMRKEKMNKITLCRHYPSLQIYPEFYERIEQELVSSLEKLFYFDIGFYAHSGLLSLHNIWKNTPYIWGNPGISSFYNIFTGRPAVIVSSGPSLEKNITQLRKYRDKVIIIASASAVGALQKHHIIPHFIAVVDPFQDDRVCEVIKADEYKNTGLIAFYESYHKQMAEFPGKKFFCTNISNIPDNPVANMLPNTTPLRISGSVATLAFDFAYHSGANPIVFIGQDLAMGPLVKETEEDDPQNPDKKIKTMHFKYSGAGSVTDDTVGIHEEECAYVVGQKGETLVTRFVLKEALETLQMLIGSMPDRTIINATEGGAYIAGAIHATFKNTANRYFNHNIDVMAVMNQVMEEFTPQHGEELYQTIQSIIYDMNIFLANNQEFKVDKEQPEQMIVKIEEYFSKVKAASFYVYIQQHMDAYYDMLLYEQRAGGELAANWLIYNGLKKYTDQIIAKLHENVSDCLAVLRRAIDEKTGGNRCE